MTAMFTPGGLLRAVRRYCRARHITAVGFSRKLVENPQFVANLRNGRMPSRRAGKIARSILSVGKEPPPSRDGEAR